MKLSMIAASAVFMMTVSATPSFAEESTSEKVEASAQDGVNQTKRAYRKTKKKVRDATGNESTKEDIKDNAKNAGDDINAKSKELKNKVD